MQHTFFNHSLTIYIFISSHRVILTLIPKLGLYKTQTKRISLANLYSNTQNPCPPAIYWNGDQIGSPGALAGNKMLQMIWSVGGEEGPKINRIQQMIRFIKKKNCECNGPLRNVVKMNCFKDCHPFGIVWGKSWEEFLMKNLAMIVALGTIFWFTNYMPFYRQLKKHDPTVLFCYPVF